MCWLLTTTKCTILDMSLNRDYLLTIEGKYILNQPSDYSICRAFNMFKSTSTSLFTGGTYFLLKFKQLS